MSKTTVFILLTVFLASFASAQNSDLSQVSDIFSSEDEIIYFSGPDSFCDTSCNVAGKISQATDMSTNLSTRPPTPEVSESDENLIIVGSPDYTSGKLGLSEGVRDQDLGQLILSTTSNDRQVLVVRASSESALNSTGNFLNSIFNGENIDRVAGKQEFEISSQLQDKNYDLSDASEIFGEYTSVVYGADTQNAQKTAQELAVEIGGETVDDDDLTSQEKKNRNLILLGTPGTNEYIEEIAKNTGVWNRNDWETKEGFRISFVDNAFDYGSHVLVVSANTESTLGSTTEYASDIVKGEVTGLEGRTIIRKSKTPRKVILDNNLGRDTVKVEDKITFTVKTKHSEDISDYSIQVMRNGSDITKKSSVSVKKQANTLITQFSKYGNYTITADMTDTETIDYQEASEVITVSRKERDINLSLNMNQDEITKGSKVKIRPTAEGEEVDSTLLVDGNVYSQGKQFQLKINSTGEHKLKLKKEKLLTEKEIRHFNSAEKTIQIEKPSIIQRIVRVLSGAIS